MASQPSDEANSAFYIDPEELNVHKLYRERIVQEDNLINHRMTWFFASQSFLVLAWVGLYKLPDYSAPPTASILVDLVGLVFSICTLLAISAAHSEIEWVVRHYASLYGERRQEAPHNSGDSCIASVRNSLIPDLIGGGNRHYIGHIVPIVMPIVLGICWFVTGAILVADKLNYTTVIESWLHQN